MHFCYQELAVILSLFQNWHIGYMYCYQFFQKLLTNPLSKKYFGNKTPEEY